MNTGLALAGWALAGGAALAPLAAPARAHHAFAAEFDIGKPLRLQGVVTEMEWINPHAWIHLDVKGPDGKVTSWMVEGGSPNILLPMVALITRPVMVQRPIERMKVVM